MGTQMDAGKHSSPSTRAIQFGLRSLVCAVVLAACVFAWTAKVRKEANHQHIAVAAIHSKNGYVLYDYELQSDRAANR